ncbi:MAG: ATP-binding protein [Lacunisphaera sp.]|nr:ATP-binding protein [Lacunisphaera sp.]
MLVSSQSPPPWPRWSAVSIVIASGMLAATQAFDLAGHPGPVPGGLVVNLLAALILLGGGLVLVYRRPSGPVPGLACCLRVGLGSVVVLTVTMAAGAVLAGWSMNLSVSFAQGAAALALLLLLPPQLTWRQGTLAQGCALLPALPALLALCEYLFNSPATLTMELARVAPAVAGLACLLLAAGIFFARPAPGSWAGFLLSGTEAARHTRRLLLACLLLSPVGVLSKRLIMAAGWSLETHLGFAAWLQLLVLGGLAAGFGRVLHRSDTRRLRAEMERAMALRQVEHQAALMQTEVARRTSELSRALLFNQRLALVAERTTNGVVITNPAGEIEWVNAGFSRITGHAFEDALGRKPGHLLQGPRTNPATVAFIRERLTADLGFEAEILNYHRDGREYWAAIEVQPLRDAGGRLIGFMGIESDITARKLAEDRMHAAWHEAEQLNARAQESAAEANIANQAKSAFLATMSHEIRTPLNGVLGMANLLRDTGLDSQQLEFVQTIESSGDALLRIINDILDYSKIEAGRLELEAAPFAVRQCLEDTLDLFATQAAEKNLELVGRIDPGVPGAVVGDFNRLRQILINLVGNALKFTAAGEVEVTLGARPVDGRHELHCVVRDTGIGIPADRLSRLFQPFSQVDSSTTRKYGGSGLGLAISRRLVEVMGGRMWVESDAGRGSRFHFTLLVDEEPVPEQPLWQDAPRHFAGRRVLVAAPNALLREFLTRQVAAWGADVTGVSGVAEAVAAGRPDRPWDAVLVDRKFGARDGWRDAAEIRRLPGAAARPVLLLGFPSAATRDPGFAGHLNKPVKTAALFAAMNKALGCRRASIERPDATVVPFAAPVSPTGLRVLLVEDNPVNQRVSMLLLRKLGHAPRIALDGAAALIALAQEPADLVFMDMEMPIMDGCEATRRIRAEPSSPQPWIVALTANAMEADRVRALAAGMNDFVTKPVRLADLAAALDRAPFPDQAESRRSSSA